MKALFEVDGKPFFSIGGQVHNSSAYSAEELEKGLTGAKVLGVNTIAVPLYWCLIEPEEGKFCFDQIDMIVRKAREEHMKLVLLWFGTWKNGTSHYVPNWLKLDKGRFLWAQGLNGVRTRSLSPHCNETKQADKRAFYKVMEYLRKVNTDETVIAVQVENEPGIMGAPRDYSEAGNAAYRNPAPEEVIEWLKSVPDSQAALIWQKNGSRKNACWLDTFGDESAELFTAYWFAKYVNEVAEAGKEAYQIPVYVNVWVKEIQNRIPGIDFPSGGATTTALDIWKRFAPAVDAICPDMYFEDHDTYDALCRAYSREDNLLYIPESRPGDMNALHVFRMLEDYGLTGIHCFGVDSVVDNEGRLKEESVAFQHAVGTLMAMKPLLERYQGTGRVYGIAQYEGMNSRFIDFGDFTGVVYYLNCLTEEPYVNLDTRHRDSGFLQARGKGVILYEGNGSFYLAGEGFKLVLVKKGPIEERAYGVHSGRQANMRSQEYLSVEEGFIDEEGEFHITRVRCGDESDTGLWVAHDIGLVHAVLEV